MLTKIQEYMHTFQTPQIYLGIQFSSLALSEKLTHVKPQTWLIGFKTNESRRTIQY